MTDTRHFVNVVLLRIGTIDEPLDADGLDCIVSDVGNEWVLAAKLRSYEVSEPRILELLVAKWERERRIVQAGEHEPMGSGDDPVP